MDKLYSLCTLNWRSFVCFGGGLLHVLSCVCPEILQGQKKHHTLWNNVITENSWKARVGMTDKKSNFQCCHMLLSSAAEFLFPFEGSLLILLFGSLQILFHYLCLSLPFCFLCMTSSIIVHHLPTTPFVLVYIERHS